MSFYYNGEHSVTIGEKNTWKDWKLIPNVRPDFQPPLPKNNFTSIPGGNGTLDLSETLTGYPVYEDRVGSWEFIIGDQSVSFYDIYSEIMNYLQGRRLEAVLEDDRYFHYKGRFWLNEDRSEPSHSLIVMEYQVYPYKLEPNSSTEPWLWDPFDFKYGVIRNYKDIVVNGNFGIFFPKTEEPVSPVIIASEISGSLQVSFDGNQYSLKNGRNIIPQILFDNEEIGLMFIGNGKVSIEYRGGRL